MKKASIIKRAGRISQPFRVDDGRGFRLKDQDPGDTGHWKSGQKGKAREALANGIQILAEMQDKLYAQDRYAITDRGRAAFAGFRVSNFLILGSLQTT